jgi:hypothetical protein
MASRFGLVSAVALLLVLMGAGRFFYAFDGGQNRERLLDALMKAGGM